jgi:hypothetical protein
VTVAPFELETDDGRSCSFRNRRGDGLPATWAFGYAPVRPGGAQVLQRERGVANSVTERTTTVDAGMIEMAIADGWLGFVHQVVLHRREIEDFVLCFVTNARIKSSSVLVRNARSRLLAWIAMAPAAYEPRSCSRKTTVSRRLATSTGGSADCAFLDPSPVAKLARLRAAARHA